MHHNQTPFTNKIKKKIIFFKFWKNFLFLLLIFFMFHLETFKKSTKNFELRSFCRNFEKIRKYLKKKFKKILNNALKSLFFKISKSFITFFTILIPNFFRKHQNVFTKLKKITSFFQKILKSFFRKLYNSFHNKSKSSFFYLKFKIFNKQLFVV
ncbi:hypothetical protein CVS40_9940 [Lucilia cuprina]|nr:hypothetical protein CVS40_9940 [Lucilia cuprina]